jgi:hypothetical protein
MARRIIIQDKGRFFHSSVTRKEDIKAKRRFFLIVCEGEKTEPNYFESLKDNLPVGVLNVYNFKIIGTGHNTISLVKKAKQLRSDWENETGRKIDKLWIVFDRDSFTPQSFNSAIQTHQNTPNIDCAWTNEAFELWYLLHFHFYNTGIGRTQYQQLIEQNFRKKGLDKFHYQKNSPDMYSLLEKYGDRQQAINNAKNLAQLYGERTDYANQNPCTTVYKLVEELFNLENHLSQQLF